MLNIERQCDCCLKAEPRKMENMTAVPDGWMTLGMHKGGGVYGTKDLCSTCALSLERYINERLGKPARTVSEALDARDSL